VLLVLAGIAGTVAVGAWIVAVVSALQIVRLAPAGQRLSTWFSLGWWRFDRIRAVAGPAANPLIKRYVWSFATFFAAVLGTIVVSMLVAITGQSAAAIDERTAEPRRINNPRVIAVRTAEDDRPGMISILARRFAPLPAAYA
jgi:hypothetical protein